MKHVSLIFSVLFLVGIIAYQKGIPEKQHSGISLEGIMAAVNYLPQQISRNNDELAIKATPIEFKSEIFEPTSEISTPKYYNYESALKDSQNTNTNDRLNAVKALWRLSADKNVPQGSLDLLMNLAYSQDDQLAALAQSAYDDLYLLKYGVNNSITGFQSSSSTLAYSRQALLETVNNGDSDSLRFEALNELSRYNSRENVSEIKRLMFDRSSDIRIKAIESVWRSSADFANESDLDSVSRLLYQASQDVDQRVAQYAKKAFEDIQELIAQNASVY